MEKEELQYSVTLGHVEFEDPVHHLGGSWHNKQLEGSPKYREGIQTSGVDLG
jgi:hypothetical protein